jgi:Ca-activated chloride channel family protein
MLAPRATPERLCRVVLLSDGHANQGVSDSNLIAQDVGQLARSGVSTTTIGVGSQFNEELMTAIARAGGGSAMYGNRPEDLHEPFEAELGLLRNIAWRDVTVRIVSLSRGWSCENDYPEAGTEEYAWRVPDIAAGAQAWLALSLPMSRAIDFATRRPRASLLKIEVRARASDGSVHLFKYRMPVLPTVDAAAWQAMPEVPIVARRFLETAAARLQDRAIKAVSRGEWDAVKDCLQQIEALAADHPWLRASVDEMRRLAERRDERLLSKELHYSSRSMRSRLTERGEGEYLNEAEESGKAAYLRRKSMQGRGIGGR